MAWTARFCKNYSDEVGLRQMWRYGYASCMRNGRTKEMSRDLENEDWPQSPKEIHGVDPFYPSSWLCGYKTCVQKIGGEKIVRHPSKKRSSWPYAQVRFELLNRGFAEVKKPSSKEQSRECAEGHRIYVRGQVQSINILLRTPWCSRSWKSLRTKPAD